jgi:hypothetical protein
MRPAHLDAVEHPPLRSGVAPPLRHVAPGFDQAAELIGLLLPPKPPRDGLPQAECRCNRVADAAHEGKGREAVQRQASYHYTYNAHMKDVTLCGSRQRFLLGPCPPNRRSREDHELSPPSLRHRRGRSLRATHHAPHYALRSTPRSASRWAASGCARCVTGSPDETALLPSPAPVFRSRLGGCASRDLYRQKLLLAGNEPPLLLRLGFETRPTVRLTQRRGSTGTGPPVWVHLYGSTRGVKRTGAVVETQPLVSHPPLQATSVIAGGPGLRPPAWRRRSPSRSQRSAPERRGQAPLFSGPHAAGARAAICTYKSYYWQNTNPPSF